LIKKTGFSPKVILEICSYLSLNDAINAFSTNILPLLCEAKAKVHISESSGDFIKKVVRKLEPEQIVSMYLNNDESLLQTVFTFSSMFKKVISLTLLNLRLLEKVSEYEIHFPKLIRLSLWYDNEIGFNVLHSMFGCLQKSIERFEIHCPGALCTHYETQDFVMYNIKAYNVRYFLLDIGQCCLTSTNECFQQHKSCFLMATIDLVRYMPNIRYFRLITNVNNVENWLDIDNWQRLIRFCFLLKTVTLQIIGGTSKDEQLYQKVWEIIYQLRDLGRSIKFRVVSE
jgi:hypothetical protein